MQGTLHEVDTAGWINLHICHSHLQIIPGIHHNTDTDMPHWIPATFLNSPVYEPGSELFNMQSKGAAVF